jgi:hypothetical protein
MSNMAAPTHAHIGRRWLGRQSRPSNLRGLGDDADDLALATAQLGQQGFSPSQIAALQAAGADSGTMMGIATADNSNSAYNGVMSALTGIPVSGLSSAGIGAGAANWFNTATIISGVPNWMLVGGFALVAAMAMTAEGRYR